MSDALPPAGPEPSPLPAKADPETLVLRGRPGRVVRFRRSVIVALAALAVTGVVVTAWFAFKPRSFAVVAQRDDSAEPASTPADALGDLPASYAEAPRLGPPLPGDLGQPILEHQRAPESGEGDTTPADAQRRAAEAERERIAAQAQSARASAVLVRTTAKAGLAAPPTEGGPADAIPGVKAAAASQACPAPCESGRSNALTPTSEAVASLGAGGDVNPHRIRPAASPYLLSAGSVIAASLITGLRSDLLGLVIAQVTERVYDSPTGRLLLIPQGARLIGSYDSTVAFGQRRALIVWQRIVFPDGRSLRLDNVPATDAAGHAGLEDEVDFHTWTLVKGAAISTLLGVGSNLTFTGESDLVQAIRESTEQNVARAGDQLTSRNLRIQPTITIRPGTPVRLVVHRDLVLAPPAQ
jgi:type IV secretion system protein VirB10